MNLAATGRQPDRICSYNRGMPVATSVGVRELKNHLSRYLDRVQAGEEIVVTDRGHPIARLSTVDSSISRLAALVESGAVTPPTTASRTRPRRRIRADGPVSDLVADQRR